MGDEIFIKREPCTKDIKVVFKKKTTSEQRYNTIIPIISCFLITLKIEANVGQLNQNFIFDLFRFEQIFYYD